MESDKLLPKVSISEGDPVTLQVDGKQLYYGIIMDVESNVSSHTVSYTALDLLWYVNQSDINHVYSDTPERITANICAELGVPLGSAAKTAYLYICRASEKRRMRPSWQRIPPPPGATATSTSP